MSRPAPESRTPDRLAAAGLLVACTAIFVLCPSSDHSDMRWALHAALSLIRGHWGDVSIFPIVARETGTLFRHGDGLYLVFPIGTSLLVVPPLWLLDLLAPQAVAHIETVNLASSHRFFAAPIAAGAVALFYLAARERFARPTALALALMLAFCTSTWSTASRVLWSHGPLLLTHAAALLLLLRAERRPALAAAAAVPLAIGFMIRPSAAIAIAGMTALVALRHRRYLAPYALCFAAALAPWLAYNLAVFGAPLLPYYQPGRLSGARSVGEALLGLLVSPSRGLLVFSPVLLLAVPGFAAALRNQRERALAIAFAAIIVAHWIVVARFPVWWGGHSFGPRLMSDIVPFAVLLSGYALAPIARLAPGKRRAAAAAAAVLALISATIHGSGAISRAGIYWNVTPLSVDRHPERLWDWHDPQVLAALRRWRRLP